MSNAVPDNHVSRRKFVKVAGGAVAVAVAASGVYLGYQWMNKPQGPVGVTYILATSTTNEVPVWAAVDNGYFSSLNLDTQWTTFTTSTAGIQAVAEDKATVADIGAAAIMASVVAGSPLKILAVGFRATPYYLITSPNINSIQDLKGKIWGVSALGGVDYFIGRYLLTKNGVDPSSVTFIQVPFASRQVGIKQGNVQATINGPAQMLEGKSLGLNILEFIPDHVIIPGSATFVSKNYLEKNKDVVLRILKGYIRGMSYYATQSDGVKSFITKYEKIQDPQVLDTEYKSYLSVLQKDPTPVRQDFQTMLDILAADSPQKFSGYKVDDFIDTSVMDQLKREGFLKEVWPGL